MQNQTCLNSAERVGLRTKGNVPTLRFPEFSGDWKESTIGKEFELYSGNTPSRLDKENFVGDVNWITSGELKDHYIGDTKEKISENSAKENNLRLLPEGTFVIAIYGLEAEGVRSTGSIITKQSTISQACMAFTPKGDISNEFLYSWYKKHGNVIGIRYAQGTKQQNLSYDILEKFKIRYPSLKEQDKLNSFISLLDTRIATQIRIIEDLKQLRSALYYQIFSNIQGNWVTLKMVGDIAKGKQINGSELLDEGMYYVMNGGITPSGYYNKYNTPANTISISEGGNSCGYVQYNSVPFWSGGHCYNLRIKKGFDLQYIFHFLKFKELDIMALRIGSGLPNIQKKDLEHFQVLVPDSTTQKKVSGLFVLINKKEETEMKLLNAWRKQKKYLLQKLFI